MTTTTLDLSILTTTETSKVLRLLGHKGVFSNVVKARQIEMIEAHTEDEQIEALLAIGCDATDIETMRYDAAPAADVVEAEVEAKQAVTKAKLPAPAAPTEDGQVHQIAALLSQVLATNKGALDADAVAAIVESVVGPKLENQAELMRDIGASNYSAMLDAVDAKLADIPARKLDITSAAGTVTIEGRQHMQFESLMRVIGSKNHDGGSNLNIWLTGLPGTGKTMAAGKAAEALAAKFYTNGSIANKYELTGFVDAHGKLVRTPFRDAWEYGGVYLFDEIDGSVPSAVLAFNAALANGIMAFPDGMLKRHKDCVIIAAANTSGQGATAELVGRMKQDAAFLDRFVFIAWMLDEGLESHLCANKDWAKYVQATRKRVADKGVKVMVTPRSTFYGDQLLAAGVAKADVIAMTLRRGMTDAQWSMVAN